MMDSTRSSVLVNRIKDNTDGENSEFKTLLKKKGLRVNRNTLICIVTYGGDCLLPLDVFTFTYSLRSSQKVFMSDLLFLYLRH